ncbi:MAG: hypothetical protein AVDCRST_MAG25-1326, partial [uncultured Rubrobacteraceae bacterium]
EVRVHRHQRRPAHRRAARRRGRGGRVGRGLLLGRHLRGRRDGDPRPLGGHGRDGDADEPRPDRRDSHATRPPPPVEARPRGGDPRPPLARTSGHAGRTRRPRRLRLRSGRGTDRPEGSGGKAGREPEDTGRTVERRALLLRGGALHDSRDDVSSAPCTEAAHPDLARRRVAEQEVHEPRTSLRWPARGQGERERARRAWPHAGGRPGDEVLRRGEPSTGRPLRHRVRGGDAGGRCGARGLHRAALRGGGGYVVDRGSMVAPQRARRPRSPHRPGSAPRRM